MTTNKTRVTMYAAFDGTGIPALGVWDFNRDRLLTRIADRKANGEAFPGEHSVRITVEMYNRIMAREG